jgi:4-nitrophenyl phosphatase
LSGFIIDLDGTLYAGQRSIPYAAEFIAFLQKNNLPYLLLTNNSSRLPEEVAAHLYKVSGIMVEPGKIFTSAQAAARYASHHQKRALAYCIGEKGLVQALEAAGLEVLQEIDEKDNPLTSEQIKLWPPKYVIQGIDRQFTYAKLEKAVQFITAGAAFINTNPDHLLPSENGIQPGAGSIAAAIELASQVKPIVIGKPSSIIMKYAIELIGLPPKDIWVVGDNIRTDIGGGIAVGCPTVLVLTGLATAENVQQQMDESRIQPTLICSHLMELANRL